MKISISYIARVATVASFFDRYVPKITFISIISLNHEKYYNNFIL